MKKVTIVLSMCILIMILFVACDMVKDVPTVPMATITPSPSNAPSSMPSLIPTVENTSDIIPEGSVGASTGTATADTTDQARAR